MSDSGPARKIRVVTPSDTVPLAPDCRALYLGTDGNISLSAENGEVCLHLNVKAGTVLPVRARYVYDTDTTITNIIAYY